MGVDYLQCDGCDLGFRDDSDYCAYCECGSKFCDATCGKLQNYMTLRMIDELDPNDPRIDEIVDSFNEGNYRIDPTLPITCSICRKERFTDYILLESLLKHFNLTREEAIEIAKKID